MFWMLVRRLVTSCLVGESMALKSVEGVDAKRLTVACRVFSCVCTVLKFLCRLALSLGEAAVNVFRAVCILFI